MTIIIEKRHLIDSLAYERVPTYHVVCMLPDSCWLQQTCLSRRLWTFNKIHFNLKFFFCRCLIALYFFHIYIFSIIGESEQLWPMSSVCTRKRKKTAAHARFAQNVWKGEKNCTERRRHTRTPSQVALFSCLLQHIIFVRCPSTRSSLSVLVLLIFFSAPFQLMNLLGREFPTVSSRDCVKKIEEILSSSLHAALRNWPELSLELGSFPSSILLLLLLHASFAFYRFMSERVGPLRDF